MFQVVDIIDAGPQDTPVVEETLGKLSDLTAQSTESGNIIETGDLNATLLILDLLASGRHDSHAAVSTKEIMVQ